MDDVVLLSREIDLKGIEKEEFIKVMSEDLEKVKEEYHNRFYPKALEKFTKFSKKVKEDYETRARKTAEKKWKTEKYREAYVKSEMKKYKGPIFKFLEIEYFDVDLEPGRNGIKGDAILKPDNRTPEAIGACYEAIKDNKYFRNGKGWIFINREHSRPYLKLILPPDYEKMYREEAENLERAIGEFYKGTTYFGD